VIRKAKITAAYPDMMYYSAFIGDINKTGGSDEGYLIINKTYKTNTVTIDRESYGHATVYDPLEGKAARVSLPFEIGVAEYSAVVVVFGE